MLPTPWKRLVNTAQLPMSDPMTSGIPASYIAFVADIDDSSCAPNCELENTRGPSQRMRNRGTQLGALSSMMVTDISVEFSALAAVARCSSGTSRCNQGWSMRSG
jgi:hypothetical protein